MYADDYRLRQREYLLQISRAMTSKLDMPSVLRLILGHAVDMLRGVSGLIALKEEDGSFSIRASYGLSPDLLPHLNALLGGLPVSLGGGGTSRWRIPGLRSRLALVVASTGVSLRQVVALPLLQEDNLVGVILIFGDSDVAFSNNDRQVLASFADQAAIAMQNARLYQDLAREKSRLDAIIDISADGVMILDPQGRIQAFNVALSQMTGWAEEAAREQPCWRVLDLRDRNGDKLCRKSCPVKNSQLLEGRLIQEGYILRSDGTRTDVSVAYTPLYDQQERLVNVLANVRDITRFREAEEMKSTFISVISHELKTPVAIIKGYVGTLRREDAHWDEKTLKESLASVEEQVDRLNHLIDNLLDASRIQSGAFKMDVGDIDLPGLAERVAKQFRPQTQTHRIAVHFPPCFPLVQGDAERLEEVFANLIGNAIKYSPQGGGIQVGGQVGSGGVLVYVADEGIGIPKGEQENIFRPFYRVEGDAGQETQGAGLGLYLCQAIVEAHGGRIWVESGPSKGSRFVFFLPLQEVAEEGNLDLVRRETDSAG